MIVEVDEGVRVGLWVVVEGPLGHEAEVAQEQEQVWG